MVVVCTRVLYYCQTTWDVTGALLSLVVPSQIAIGGQTIDGAYHKLSLHYPLLLQQQQPPIQSLELPEWVIPNSSDQTSE